MNHWGRGSLVLITPTPQTFRHEHVSADIIRRIITSLSRGRFSLAQFLYNCNSSASAFVKAVAAVVNVTQDLIVMIMWHHVKAENFLLCRDSGQDLLKLFLRNIRAPGCDTGVMCHLCHTLITRNEIMCSYGDFNERMTSCLWEALY